MWYSRKRLAAYLKMTIIEVGMVFDIHTKHCIDGVSMQTATFFVVQFYTLGTFIKLPLF